MKPLARDPQWANILQNKVKCALYTAGHASSEVTSAELKSERIQFLSAFWIMALEKARTEGLSPESSEVWHLTE